MEVGYEKVERTLIECSLKERQIILYILLGMAMFLVVLGWCSYVFLVILGILALFLMLFYSLLAFRCPFCNACLGVRMVGYSHCPKCGKELEQRQSLSQLR